jgi:hypothetical protein
MGKEPDFEELERKQNDKWDDEDQERGRRRQTFDPDCEPPLERVDRKPRDDPRHDRRKMIPQPRLQQKDKREQDPERTQ